MSYAALQSATLRVNTVNLVQHLKLAFTNSDTFIKELLQNARRAGATRIDIVFDEEAKSMIVADNGVGIGDLQNLLSVAESGWDEEVMEAETPYGLGFLSALFAAERVTVDSRRQMLSFDTESALGFSSFPIQASSVDEGAVVKLEGLKAEIKPVAIEKMVRGFPVPVFLNGKELPRPHALGEGSPFERLEEGDFFFHDIDRDFRDSGEKLGCDGFILYLQGFEVYRSRYSGRSNIVHLNPRLFHGRLPDRDKLVNELDAINKVAAVVEQRWEVRLKELLEKHDPKVVAAKGYQTLKFWAKLELLNDNPWLPADVVEMFSDYPIHNREWEDIRTNPEDPIHKDDILKGNVSLVLGATEVEETETFLPLMYLYGREAMVVNERALDREHWIHRMLLPMVNNETVGMEMIGECTEAEFFGARCDVKVIFCDEIKVSGPLGELTIDDDAFFHVNEGGRGVVFVPKGEVRGSVVRQVDNYSDEFDTFLEGDAEEDEDNLSRFIFSHRPGNEASALQGLLVKAGALQLGNLSGKSFKVSFNPDAPFAERMVVELI